MGRGGPSELTAKLRKINGGRVIVRGHSGSNEGIIKDSLGRQVSVGPAVCSCGKRSEDLPSNAERVNWHVEHKIKMLEEKAARRKPKGLQDVRGTL